jgi:alginate O-acetyltransferase complex protein AlgI
MKNFGVMLAILAFASTPLPKLLYQRLPKKLAAVTTPLFVALILLFCTAYLVDGTYNPFLYFRF